MEITFNLITLITLVAAVLGILSAFIILYFGVKANSANQPLAIGQFSISLAIFVSFSHVSKLILFWPYMYRLGHLFALIFIPMTYLHVIFYTRNRRWRWYDLLHAIPLLIFLIDYSHVLLMSNAEKLQILRYEVNDLNLLGEFRQSKYFGPRFHQEARTVLLSGYWVAQVVLLIKWLKGQTHLSPQQKIWKTWIIVFLGFQFFMWCPFYLSLFGMEIMTTYFIVNSFSVIWLLLSSLSLFFFPSLLYGRGPADFNNEKKVVRKSTPTTDEEDKKWEELIRVIEYQMDVNRLFLKQGYSINDFSRDTQIPVYQISKSINHFRGMSFVDFINQKRIQYCVNKIDSGEWLTYKVEAIAFECGFHSRNSFTLAFKKVQGALPSDYRKRK